MANLLHQHLPFKLISHIFSEYNEFMIFETQKYDDYNYKSYIFINPIKTIETYDLKECWLLIEELEKNISAGYYVAGFFSYEFGYGLDYVDEENTKQDIKQDFDFPLAYFCVFKEPIIYDHRTKSYNNTIDVKLDTKVRLGYKIKNFHLNVNEKEFTQNIKTIKNYIAVGDTYQVNYTIKCKFDFLGSPLGLYHNLRNTQKVSYSAFIKTKKFIVLSFSPELFFRKIGPDITVKPMKGTIARMYDLEGDKGMAMRLYRSIKNRSENVMIVDLLRNDLSKISLRGSVKVKKLFEIEKYETLFQMTSTIISKLNDNYSLYELFKSIFPSGSVTGAPKIRTMQIIKKLEKEPRKLYTGSIGFITPQKDAIFNVAIRTVILEGTKGEMGVGSGIVWDSNPKKEYEECKLKSLFLYKRHKPFRLIETILWSSKKGYFLLEYHLQRLKNSAKYFGFQYDEEKIKKKLFELQKNFKNNSNYRVRMLLDSNGKVYLTFQKIIKEKNKKPKLVILSEHRTDPNNVFLYHKTTQRKIYNTEYEKHRKQGYFDVLFMNTKDEITEFSRGNIIIKIKNKYITPKITSGLLPGVFRRYFMETHKVEERIVTLDDLKSADKIFFCNSVIGLKKVKLVRKSNS